MEGNVLQVFSSYQGEGIYAGVPQVFVRFGGCHMRCSYCDTPESWTHQKSGEFEWPPFSRQMDVFENPVSAEALLKRVHRHLETGKYHSVSITGGEPLLHSDFLAEFLPRLGAKIYLETSGTLGPRLRKVIDFCDIIAFDIKLADCEGVSMDIADITDCINIAAGKDYFCKVVVMETSSTAEFEKLMRTIVSCAGTFPLVFTPVSPVNQNCIEPTGERIHSFIRISESLGFKPVVVPQLHRLAGWL